MVRQRLIFSGCWLLALLLAACGGSSTETPAPATTAGNPVQEATLSEAELANGIGPIQDLTLGPIDAALAAQGEASYTTKCTACHKMDTRYVGPPLGTVLQERTPAYIMNMMLNPDEMTKKHPEARAMLAQYMTVMPNQNLTQDEARAILEYLRQQQTAPQ